MPLLAACRRCRRFLRCARQPPPCSPPPRVTLLLHAAFFSPCVTRFASAAISLLLFCLLAVFRHCRFIAWLVMIGFGFVLLAVSFFCLAFRWFQHWRLLPKVSFRFFTAWLAAACQLAVILLRLRFIATPVFACRHAIAAWLPPPPPPPLHAVNTMYVLPMSRFVSRARLFSPARRMPPLSARLLPPPPPLR